MSAIIARMDTWRDGTSWRSRNALSKVHVRGVVLIVKRLLSASEKTVTSVSKIEVLSDCVSSVPLRPPVVVRFDVEVVLVRPELELLERFRLDELELLSLSEEDELRDDEDLPSPNVELLVVVVVLKNASSALESLSTVVWLTL